MRPLGFIIYTSERQAAIAYDEHMIKECGYDAALNFDAYSHKVRLRSLNVSKFQVPLLMSSFVHAYLDDPPVTSFHHVAASSSLKYVMV